MERTGGANHLFALGITVHKMVFAGNFQRPFHRLGAGITEEASVSEGIGDQTIGELLLPRDVVQVRDMPKLASLFLHLGDQMRVRVAQRIGRYTGGEVEESSPISAIQVGPFAPLESDVDPPVSGHHRCNHETSPS